MKLKKWSRVYISLSIFFFGIGIIMSFIPKELFFESGSIIAVIFISLPVFYAMYKIYGKTGIWIMIALGLFALSIESIGIHTGWPYSPFEYTSDFGYRLFGTTPWTVSLAWSPLVIGSFALSKTWFKKRWSQFLCYLGILVATDVILDPGAVARGLWEYSNGGFWYGVPLQNFVGWIISGTLAYLLIDLFLKEKNTKLFSENKYMGIASLSLLLSIFLWSGVNAGYTLWLPGILGLILGNIILFTIISHKKISYT